MPAGIDQVERRPLPLGRQRIDVAGRPGHRGDDGAAGSGDAVEECGLSDVGPADQHNRWADDGAFQQACVKVLS